MILKIENRDFEKEFCDTAKRMTNDHVVELTPELIEKAQKRLDFIASEGCTVNGVDETIDAAVPPNWYDEERFRRGQQLVQKHYTAYAI